MVETDNKIRVVHLITQLELGGAQGNTLHTVKNLNPSQYDVQLWCGPGAFWDYAVRSNSTFANRTRFFKHLVRPVHPLYDLLIIFDLYRAFKTTKPEIVHTHSSKAGIVGRLAAWLAGVPIVIHTFHGFGFNQEQKPWTRWLFVSLERVVAPLSHKLIFVSQSNLETARLLSIGKPEQYTLIRSGIPLADMERKARAKDKNEHRKDLTIPLDKKIITTIGPFKPQKNLGAFLEMASSLRDKREDVEFIIIGDGALRPILENKIQTLNLSSVVHLVGWQKEVAPYLAASDLFVLTSLWEGLPRALVEALALGVPAVCFDTDGIRDLLIIGGGIIVPQHNVPAMVKAVDSVLTQPASSFFTNDLKNKIKTEFDIDNMVRQQESLYKQLLDEKHLVKST